MKWLVKRKKLSRPLKRYTRYTTFFQSYISDCKRGWLMKLWPNSTFKDIRYVRTKLELRDSREMDEKWSTTCHVLGQNDLRVESSLWSFWVQSSDLFLQVQIRKWILCHCNLKIETSFFYLLSNTKKSLFLSCHLWRQYILQVQKKYAFAT